MTFKGSGVAKSNFLGFRLLTKAAERGYPDAQADLVFLRLEESDLDAERALEALSGTAWLLAKATPGPPTLSGRCAKRAGGAPKIWKRQPAHGLGSRFGLFPGPERRHLRRLGPASAGLGKACVWIFLGKGLGPREILA